MERIVYEEPCKSIKHLYKKRKNYWEKRSPSETRGTIEFFITRSFSAIKQRCVNTAKVKRSVYSSYFEKGIELRMSIDEFRDFCLKNKEEILKIYSLGKSPSVDRIKSNEHYEIGNIQILERFENIEKDRHKTMKKVTMTNESGVSTIFNSLNEAHKKTGFPENSISRCCNQKRFYKGYYWSYNG